MKAADLLKTLTPTIPAEEQQVIDDFKNLLQKNRSAYSQLFNDEYDVVSQNLYGLVTSINSLHENDPHTEKIKNTAYRTLTRYILNRNIKNPESPIDFVFDKKHKKQIEELQQITDVIHHRGVQETPEKPRQFYRFEEILGIAALKRGMDSIDKTVNNQLNSWRQYFKSDPTKRSLLNRAKQVAGFTLNSFAFFGKQCVNAIRKPIGFSYNTLRTIGTGAATLATFPFNRNKSKQHYQAFKQSAKDMASDFGGMLLSGCTIFSAIVCTPIGGPIIGAALGGAIGSIIPAAGSATTNAVVAVYNLLWTNPTSIAAQTVYMGAESVYHVVDYAKTNPKHVYTEEERQQLSSLLNRSKNKELDVSTRQQALEALNKLESFYKSDHLREQGITGKAIRRINRAAEKAVERAH